MRPLYILLAMLVEPNHQGFWSLHKFAFGLGWAGSGSPFSCRGPLSGSMFGVGGEWLRGMGVFQGGFQRTVLIAAESSKFTTLKHRFRSRLLGVKHDQAVLSDCFFFLFFNQPKIGTLVPWRILIQLPLSEAMVLGGFAPPPPVPWPQNLSSPEVCSSTLKKANAACL